MKKYEIYKYFDDCQETLYGTYDSYEEAKQKYDELNRNNKTIYTSYRLKEADVLDPSTLKKGDILYDSNDKFFRIFELVATSEELTQQARKEEGHNNIIVCSSLVRNLEDNNVYSDDSGFKNFHKLEDTHPNLFKKLIKFKNIKELWQDMKLEFWSQMTSGTFGAKPVSDEYSKIFSMNDIDYLIENLDEKLNK